MPQFQPFDLAKAYTDAEQIKEMRSARANREGFLGVAQMNAQTNLQANEAEARKAAEEQEARMLLPMIKAGNPQAIERAVGRISEHDPQAAQWFAQNPEKLVDVIEQGLGMKPDAQIGALYKVDRNGQPVYLPAEEAQGQSPWREPEKAGGGTTFVMPSMGEREWSFFNKLSPEDQAKYLELQRRGATPATAAALAEATEGGKATATAVADLPRVEANAADMRTQLRNLRTSPGLRYIFGVSSMAPIVPGTPQADAFAVWQQVQGKAFLEAFNTLKGGGQITQVEGEKATAAITRLSNRQQSLGGALKAIRELEEITNAAEARARAKAARSQRAPAASPGAVNFDDLPE